jgi:hypothetical protein
MRCHTAALEKWNQKTKGLDEVYIRTNQQDQDHEYEYENEGESSRSITIYG